MLNVGRRSVSCWVDCLKWTILYQLSFQGDVQGCNHRVFLQVPRLSREK